MNYGKFSKPDETAYRITPLGAAVVEAMPDRAKMKAIEREYKDTGYCPPSKLFTVEQVAEWCSRQKP